MRKAVLTVMMIAVALPALAQTAADGIRQADQRFEQAFNSGNADALAQLYTENASILPPGAPMASGRAAISQFWRGAINGGLKNLSLQPISIGGRGDAAREIGRFTLDAPGSQGQTKRVEGKYVVIWLNHEGWKLDTDIWNLDR
ncbi:MAG: DUF4440 domain-containing protein [Acidisphaera sp.]|nr:DUF4440 domain-containing protein [Acidisphaera sp.]